MSDTRVRVAKRGKAVHLDQLDRETGGYGLVESDTEVVAVEGSPVTEAELAAALAAHVPGHVPLGHAGVAATLNAVLGVWPLADAARAVHLPEQSLIDEANAWAAAGGA